MNKFEKEKLLNLLQSNEEELAVLIAKSEKFADNNKNIYDVLLKVLQEGHNIREATLLGILLGEKLGYEKAQNEIEQEIKDRLYKAFKNNQIK
tara:strand:- start:637 stop:915 length:279 start_codon:yes stop_codon:yes gene_type:complete